MKAKLICRNIKGKKMYGVEWENGFESAMPNEETAHLVIAARLMYCALEEINALANNEGEQPGFSLKAQKITQDAMFVAKGGV